MKYKKQALFCRGLRAVLLQKKTQHTSLEQRLQGYPLINRYLRQSRRALLDKTYSSRCTNNLSYTHCFEQLRIYVIYIAACSGGLNSAVRMEPPPPPSTIELTLTQCEDPSVPTAMSPSPSDYFRRGPWHGTAHDANRPHRDTSQYRRVRTPQAKLSKSSGFWIAIGFPL